MIRLLHIITFYQRFVLYTRPHTHTHTHAYTHRHTQTNYLYNFLLEFRNCHCNTNFLLLFSSADKTHYIYGSCRSSHFRCSIKKMFLKNSQFSKENTCVRVGVSFLILKFLREPFLQNTSERLLLQLASAACFCSCYDRTSVCLKRPWIDISTVYSFYR